MEKGSVVWTLTSGSSGEWRREVLCGHKHPGGVGSGEGKCNVDTNIRE